MNLSAWDIYWVLQLDTFGMAASLIALFGLVALVFAWDAAMTYERTAGFIAAGALSAAWGVVVLVAIFLPSTKTAAAMLIVPAIANNETIQQEAGDLYKLAKEALSDAVRKPAEPKESEQ